MTEVEARACGEVLENIKRVIGESDEIPTIKDSGSRRQFYDSDGNPMAVRDIQEGKGRCDLLPLDVVGYLYNQKTPQKVAGEIILSICEFVKSGRTEPLEHAIEVFLLDEQAFEDCNWSTMFLEVSKHFEEGAKKYGERNWEKGIPTHCYIDSAVRHYLKWLRGDKDEPHHRSFCWNILCCISTCQNKPELNDYPISDFL